MGREHTLYDLNYFTNNEICFMALSVVLVIVLCTLEKNMFSIVGWKFYGCQLCHLDDSVVQSCIFLKIFYLVFFLPVRERNESKSPTHIIVSMFISLLTFIGYFFFLKNSFKYLFIFLLGYSFLQCCVSFYCTAK